MQKKPTRRSPLTCDDGFHVRHWIGRRRWLQLFRQAEGVDYPHETELRLSQLYVCRDCGTLGIVRLVAEWPTAAPF